VISPDRTHSRYTSQVAIAARFSPRYFIGPCVGVALVVVLQPVAADGIDLKGHVDRRPAGLG
jgi:hypothetical protein